MVPSLNARRHAEEAFRSIARDDDSAGREGNPTRCPRQWYPQAIVSQGGACTRGSSRKEESVTFFFPKMNGGDRRKNL